MIPMVSEAMEKRGIKVILSSKCGLCATSMSRCVQWSSVLKTGLPGLVICFTLDNIHVGCMRQVLRPGALGRPREIGWKGRWEVGSGWGTHVNPWLIHFKVWQNPLQYCKVISPQLIKKNIIKKKIKTGLDVRVAIWTTDCMPKEGWEHAFTVNV